MMTTIAMICLIAGVFMIAAGWNSVPRNGMILGAGALMTLGGAFIGIGGNPARDMPNGSPPMVMMGFMFVIGAIAILIPGIIAASRKSKAAQENAKTEKLVSFYQACLQESVRSCESPRDIQKAQLIADRMGMAYPGGIQELYNRAKSAKEGQVRAEKEKQYSDKLAQEQARYEYLTRYANLQGRDKRIAMLSAERQNALARAKTMHDGSMAIMRGSQQKEMDWAVHGGIASGIAGTAAGVSTALDIQRKNAQIRAQNEANLRAMTPVILAASDAESRARREAEELQRQIDAASIKLVADTPAEKVLSQMRFQDTKVSVSETGAFTVTTTATAPSLVVFDNPDAVADGTVLAKVYQKRSFVGVAQLVLPTYGVGKSPAKLEGICLGGAEPGVECTVTFAAANLWAMER